MSDTNILEPVKGSLGWTINLFQDINRTIAAQFENIVYAPKIGEYPSLLTTMNTPICLTNANDGTFSSACESGTSTTSFTITVLLDVIGQGSLGWKTFNYIDFRQAFRNKYLNSSTYVNSNCCRKVLSYAPLVEILGDFSDTSIQVLEFPRDSGLPYTGFEITFEVLSRIVVCP